MARLLFGVLVYGACTISCSNVRSDEAAAAATGGSPETVHSLHEIVATGRLADLRWPDFPDYRDKVTAFYEYSNYSPAWIRDNQATPQAGAIIAILRQAEAKGLNAEDYDASRWDERMKQLSQPDAAARFDAALTVCLMRYVSDLHQDGKELLFDSRKDAFSKAQILGQSNSEWFKLS
jgi:murein L,D-transpeptidase YcbB/YkuD